MRALDRRPRWTFSLLLALFVSASLGCGDDDPTGPSSKPTGSIEVTVEVDEAVATTRTITTIHVAATHQTNGTVHDVDLTAPAGVTIQTTSFVDVRTGAWDLEVVHLDDAGAEVARSQVTAHVFADTKVILANELTAAAAPGELSSPWKTTISGELLYDGRILPTVTSVVPTVWVRDTSANQVVDDLEFSYDPVSGRYSITGLPLARLAMDVRVHLRGGSAFYPGNYSTHTQLDLRPEVVRDRAQIDIGVQRNIHLVAPFDNDSNGLVVGSYLVHESPVNFGWDAIPEAQSYSWTIDEFETVPAYTQLRQVAHEVNGTTTFELELEHTTATSVFVLRIFGNADSGIVGRFLRLYSNGYSGDYRFRVQ